MHRRERLAADIMLFCVVPTPFELRTRLDQLRKGASSISLRYEWVKDWTRLSMIITEGGDWEISDGQEWITFTLTMR